MGSYLYNGVKLPAIPASFLKYGKFLVIKYGIWSKDWASLYIFDQKPYVTVGSNDKYVLHSSGGKSWHGGSMSVSDPDNWYEIPIEDDGVSTGAVGLLWANFDVPNEDEAILLPASYPIDPETGEEIRLYDPIPVGSAPEVKPKSFMAGWRMGQIVRAMRMNSPGITPPEEEKIPIGFSYNGMVLPNIDTVWTEELKQTHQYAIVADMRDYIGTWMLELVSESFYQHTEKYFDVPIGTNYQLYICQDGEWIMENEGTTSKNLEVGFTTGSQVDLWTSHDIINADDSVYLSATDPIPVYE